MGENGGGILGRVGEKVLSWVALGLLILVGVGIYKLGDTGRAALWAGIWRTVVWLLVAAALPWSARFFISRVIEIGSNWAAFGLLAAYILVDLIFGWVMMQTLPQTGWGWTAALAALAVAGTYNYLVAEYLTEQAGG